MSRFFAKIRFIFSEMWQGISRSITLTIALIATFAISLSLMGVSLLVGAQVDEMKDYWFDRVEVSLFLCTAGSDNANCEGAVTQEQKDQFQADFDELRPLVSEVFFESNQEAYERFVERFSDSPIAANVSPEQLPESFRVKLSDPEQFLVIVEKFSNRPGVEAVRDQRATLNSLFAVLNGLQILALGFAASMLVVTMLLISNTIRVTAYARRRELAIMRLVGASKASIRLPFLLETAFSAIVGSLLAGAVLAGVKGYLVDEIIATRFLFTSFFGWEAVQEAILISTAAGLALALFASWIGMSRHLKA
ncbi:MAG: permease-like cell division protein FtsX [Candidatus Nanopelagicales bacterium]